MATTERPGPAARRKARRAIGDLVDDLRATRVAHGLSQEAVARAAGITRHQLGRLERGAVGETPFETVAAIAGVLGLATSIGTYPAGEPLRDSVQVRLLATFRAGLHPSLAWRTEVPLPIQGDRRAWDAVVTADNTWTGIEGISRLGAVDATVRRIQQKARDDPRIGRIVLVVLDTARNRQALAASIALLRPDFALGTHETMRSLRSGHAPAANGIVLLRVPRAGARPQDVHSGGKVVDEVDPPTATLVDKPVGALAPGP